MELRPLPAVNSKFIGESSEADAVFAGGVRAEAADSCENVGEVGAEAGQAESAGGGAGAAGA